MTPQSASIADRLPLLRRRVRLAHAVRSFFHARGALEVETPYAVRTPGEEVHLLPFAIERLHPDGTTERLFLHTSPEFAMKRLVAATGEPVFQMARVWRNGEGGALHAAEFTMLEWYRPGSTMAALMDETEALLRAVLPPEVSWRGVACRIDQPFERLTLQEAFARYVGCDLLASAGDAGRLARDAGETLRAGESWEDLFFRLLLGRIEPHIGRGRPTFLTHWPESQAALARRTQEDPRTALRFELYACGLELANAFEELTDAEEQRVRFLRDRSRPERQGAGTQWPLDEALLAALPDLPPCAGIALGFDRLVMLATGTPRIADVLWIAD